MKLKLLFIITTLLANQVISQIQLNQLRAGDYENQMLGYLTDIDDQGCRVAITQLSYPDAQNVNLEVLIYEYQAGSWKQLGEKLIFKKIKKWFGHAISLSGDGNSIAVGLSYIDVNQTNDGKIVVYKFVNEVWTKQGSEIIGKQENGNFGFSIDISFDGNVVCVGAPAIMNGLDQFGEVTIYELINNDWMQKGNTLKGESKMRGFGYNVSLSNDGQFLSLNAPGDQSLYSRKVKVFKFGVVDWIKIGEASNPKEDKELKYGVNHALAKDAHKLFVYKEFGVYSAMDFYTLNINELKKKDQEISGVDGCLELGRRFDIDKTGKFLVLDCSPAKVKVFKEENGELSQINKEILLENTNSITSISVSGNGKRFVIGSHSSRNENKKYGEVRVYDILD